MISVGDIADAAAPAAATGRADPETPANASVTRGPPRKVTTVFARRQLPARRRMHHMETAPLPGGSGAVRPNLLTAQKRKFTTPRMLFQLNRLSLRAMSVPVVFGARTNGLFASAVPWVTRTRVSSSL